MTHQRFGGKGRPLTQLLVVITSQINILDVLSVSPSLPGVVEFHFLEVFIPQRQDRRTLE